ncbi:hypothetical protein AQUCO_04200060v1 [Aquilegia coerulea]|uniref:Bifunctional inhibitor/plant lipid transfer protein/seed storage helical domain-containing protein n=1 Tax=Aquilegia coerulea TaxID=218851 RepID=A0A2G5CP13_AQUCA|nr:hypothetical protein AQUCO_04200060v1 [Aquilegia coerulea]
MGRLAIVGALLLLVLALAEASVYQTIVTTAEFDEPNASESVWCRMVLRGMKMDSCWFYLRPYTRPIESCCQELRQVKDPQCRCEALKRAAQGGGGYEQKQGVMSKVQDLPDACGMTELRNCQIFQHVY